MKKFASILMAMVMTIATCIFNAPVTVNAVGGIAKSESNMLEYLQKFEKPFYGSSWKDFDLCDDDQLDVFDLCLLKQKALKEGEASGITVNTVKKLQAWLLAEPNAKLEVSEIYKPFKKVNSYDTQCLQNLFSNDFRYVKASHGDLANYFAITLWFLNDSETVLEGATFTAFASTLEYADNVICEEDGFSIIEMDGTYVLCFKEDILKDEEPEETTTTETSQVSTTAPAESTTTASETTTTTATTTQASETTTVTVTETAVETTTTTEPSGIGPVALAFDLTRNDKKIIPAVKEALSNKFDKVDWVVDDNRNRAGVYFANNDIQVGLLVPLASKTVITGEVLYFDNKLIIVYDELYGFEIYFK